MKCKNWWRTAGRKYITSSTSTVYLRLLSVGVSFLINEPHIGFFDDVTNNL
jgi:hypothetical protein